MAGEWIRMRVSLVAHPRVIAISNFLVERPEFQAWAGLKEVDRAAQLDGDARDEALRNASHVTRFITVTALLKMWGFCNEYARDEFIANITFSDVDEQSGVPGFGRAMEAAGWLKYDGRRRGMELPNFNEFNSVSSARSPAASAAERQKRYRERRRAESEKRNEPSRNASRVTRNVTGNVREEKSIDREGERNAHPETTGRIKPAKQAASKRCPADFVVTDEMREWAEREAPGANVDRETKKFADYQFKTAYTDWPATWRNWMRRAAERAAPPRAAGEGLSEYSDPSSDIFAGAI